MYRRRLHAREKIAFSFDSFLDVVTNVVGIIIRLILVAWVGGRSYSAVMQRAELPETAHAHGAAPKADDDPLAEQLRRTQRELEAARARLQTQLQDLGLTEQRGRAVQAQLATLSIQRQQLQEQRQNLARAGGDKAQSMRLAALSMEELKRRQQTLLDDLKKLELEAPPKKELRYRTPVSHSVQADEMFFECQGGRVAFIDLQAFLQEIQNKLDDKVAQLRTRWKVEESTLPVGAFRLNYMIEREQDAVEAFGNAGKPRADGGFRYGLTGWIVEPVTPIRGESLETALQPSSHFRRLVDALDSTTVVTLWVYPDSFEMFRRLRDYLYDRGLEVAGRPLPPGAPIAASRHGSASRGQ